MKVLVVEAHPQQSKLIQEVVTSRGHEVEACTAAESGWMAYQRRFHPLVVVDNDLSGMGGLELCRRIRDLSTSTHSVILMITSEDAPEALEKILEVGADDYISRPLTAPLLQLRVAIAERRARDIRERDSKEERLVHDALHDPLTGLANRPVLLDRLDRAARTAARKRGHLFSVLYLDIDGFASITEAHGRDASDQILIEASRRLEETVRSIDTIARLGAAEFAVLLDDLRDVSDPIRIVNRIHHVLSQPFQLDGQEVHCTGSVGIALSSAGYERSEDLLRDAHTAMARARSQGPGYHQIFDPIMNARVMARVQLEARIRRAVEQEQMTVYYQPIFCVATRAILGFEALIRWHDPERGEMDPADFVPVAEETGLIAPIGWWTLEKACAQLRQWLDQFPKAGDLTMSVNVSGAQFAQPDVLRHVTSRLKAAKLDGERLHLEITESTLMEDVESTTAALARLKEASVALHVDDFGTGYSSLAYLCRFPIDTLKIDRTFIGQMSHSPENLEIVRTIVRLAKNLDMSLIAEGVETEAQLAKLRELECDAAQGHLFSRALDREAATKLLAQQFGPA